MKATLQGREAALDRLLAVDRVEPSAGFDAVFAARLAGEAGDVEGRLDALLDADGAAPSAGFDAGFAARLAGEAGDGEGRLDALLDADGVAPSAGFDARVLAAVADEPASGRLLLFPRRWAVGAIGVALAAAAALALWVVASRDGASGEVPAGELAMMHHLDLLEVYDELRVLDGIEDDETFELVAMLHRLDEEAQP